LQQSRGVVPRATRCQGCEHPSEVGRERRLPPSMECPYVNETHTLPPETPPEAKATLAISLDGGEGFPSPMGGHGKQVTAIEDRRKRRHGGVVR